jgi:hypothetical protein
MNWLFLSVAALGIAAVALSRYRPWLEDALRPAAKSKDSAPSLRQTTLLDRMIAEVKRERDPLERHRLLTAIVEESHRRRADPAMKKLFLRFAGMHVRELPKMAAALKADGKGRLAEVASFTLLAEALEEDGRTGEALEVCRKAEALGLQDSARGGFAGRIRKLEKKAARPAAAAKRKRASGPRPRRARRS